MVDVLPECKWETGKGESASHDLGNTLSLDECLRECYALSRDYSRSGVPRVNGVSWGRNPTSTSTYRKCLCIYSHGSVASITVDDQSYQTCIFPLPGKVMVLMSFQVYLDTQ